LIDVDDLLENCSQPYVLADLAYLSYELREQLKQKGYHFQNFVLFDVEQTLARGLMRLTSTTSKNLYLTINKTLNE